MSLFEPPQRVDSVGPHSRSGDGTSCAYCSREASKPNSHNSVAWPCAAIRAARAGHYGRRTPGEEADG